MSDIGDQAETFLRDHHMDEIEKIGQEYADRGAVAFAALDDVILAIDEMRAKYGEGPAQTAVTAAVTRLREIADEIEQM